MTDYDGAWKEALDDFLEWCLAFFFPEIHADVDWSRPCESLDTELQKIVRDAKQGQKFVDKLVKVWLKNGEEKWLLLHVEVQVWRESDFARRMYVYNYRIADRYDREVVSLAILADDDPQWRPSHYESSRWGFRMRMEFPVVKLLDYVGREQALEADPNPFGMVVLAHLKTLQTRRDPAARQQWMVRLVKKLYDRGLGIDDLRRLRRFIDHVMELPPELATRVHEEIRQYEEDKKMPYVPTYERKAHEEGWKAGKQEGKQEGLDEGRQKSLSKIIKLGLENKFGEEGRRLFSQIEALNDADQLDAIALALVTASTLDDVRRACHRHASVPDSN